MSEKDKKEEKINFDSVIEIFSTYIRRFEEKGLDWSEKDWIQWGTDLTDAIVDIYHYLKSMGILMHGLSELLYTPKKEEDIDNINNKNSLYS